MGLVDHNHIMNAVDVHNQIRTGWYSTEMDHNARKWTNRICEYIDDIASTNVWNIWRVNNPVLAKKKYAHF